MANPMERNTHNQIWASLNKNISKGEFGFQTRTQNRPHTHAPRVLRLRLRDLYGHQGKVVAHMSRVPLEYICEFGFQTRTQNRPHTHPLQVLRGSKGSGASIAIRSSGPLDHSTPRVVWVDLGFRPHTHSPRVLSSEGSERSKKHTRPYQSNVPLTLMAIEVPEPFEPLKTRGA